EALQVTLASPGGRRGSRRAGQGQPGTRYLPHAVGVCSPEHGSLREGGQGAWEGGQGAPHDTPRPARRVGGGRGVGGRARRPPGAYSPGRRPLASGSRASTGRGRPKDPANAQAVHARGARAGWRKGRKHGGTSGGAIEMEPEAY